MQCYAFRLSDFFFAPKFFCSSSKFDSKILFNLFNEINRVIAIFNQQSINRNEEQLILVASCDYLKFFRFYPFHDFDFIFFVGLNFFYGLSFRDSLHIRFAFDFTDESQFLFNRNDEKYEIETAA